MIQFIGYKNPIFQRDILVISKFLYKAFTKRHHFRCHYRLFYNLLLCTQCIFIQLARLVFLQNTGQVFSLFLKCASPIKPSGSLPLKWTDAPHSRMLTHLDSYDVSPLQILSIYRQVERKNNNNHNKINADAQMRWSVVLLSKHTREDPQFHASSFHHDYYTNIHTITVIKPPFFIVID